MEPAKTGLRRNHARSSPHLASLPLAASTATCGEVTISSGSNGPRHVGRVVDPLVRDDGELEPDLQLAGEGKSLGPQADAEAPVTTRHGDGQQADAGTPSSLETEAREHFADPPANTSLPPPVPDTKAPGDAPVDPLRDASVTSDAPHAGAADPTTATASEAPATSPGPDAVSPSGGHPIREKLLERARAARAHTAGTSPAPLSSAAAGAPRGLAELDDVEPPKTARDSEFDRIGTNVRSPAASLGPARGQLSPLMVAVFGSLIGLATVASLIALAMKFDEKRAQLTASKTTSEVPAPGSASVARPIGAVPKRERHKIPGPWRITDAKDDPTTRIVEGKVGTDAFLVAVADAGIKQKEAYRLLIAYKGLRDLDKCDKSDRFRALVERGSGRLKAFEYIVSAEEVYQAREDKDGYLKAKRLDLKVGRQQIKGAFMYDGEKVRTSARPAGFEKGLREVLSKALDGHMDVDELEKGDRVRVVAQEVTVLGEFARYAGIEALEILPRDKKAKPLRIYYFHHARAGGYYNGRGQAPYEGGWRKPIKDAPVTSKFNPKRMHPVLKKVMPHTGTDFGAPAGTPVGASSYGTISFIGPAGPSGNLVKIQHPGGIETGYAHLSRFAEGLSVGDKVKRMQVVGYVGSTGRSTGPHLHFTAKRDGQFFDAETLNLDGMRVLSLEYRGEFEKIKADYDKLLDAIPLPPPSKEPEQAVVAAAKPAGDAAEEDDGSESATESEDDAEELGSHAGGDDAEEEASPAPEAPTPAKPAPKGASAVYLTDKELLEMQSVSDEGEVDE